MSKRRFTIINAIDDPNLFQPWFKGRATWQSWFVFLRALFALPLTERELPLYRECTGRSEPSAVPAKEAWLICGRRSGKSFMLALIAVYLACFFNYRRHLAPGERGTVMVIAADRKQSRVVLRFIRALLMQVPMLKRMVERETAEAFDLNNAVTIEVATASYRTTRGYSIVAALLDELAFFRSDDSANPDTEIIAAIRPAMATIPNAMLLCASSPYAQRGALFDAFKQHFGKDGDQVLVWKAPTRVMNATVPQSMIDAAMEADPANAAAEYGASFRTDVEAYVGREVVEAAVIANRFELPRIEHTRYWAFTDPSGGSSDAMTLCIVHMQGNRVIVDAIRERRPPFSPDAVVQEFAATLKSYGGISTVVGDRFAAEWPRERFRVHGIEYRVAEKAKSDLYRDLLPLLNAGRIELLDNKRLVAQLCGLERKTSRAGRDTIDHLPGSFDDVANSVAGAAVTALRATLSEQEISIPAAHMVDPGLPAPGRRSTTTESYYRWRAQQSGGPPGGWTSSVPPGGFTRR